MMSNTILLDRLSTKHWSYLAIICEEKKHLSDAVIVGDGQDQSKPQLKKAKLRRLERKREVEQNKSSVKTSSAKVVLANRTPFFYRRFTW